MEKQTISAARILLAALRQGHAVSVPGTSGQRVTLTTDTRAELLADLVRLLETVRQPH